jgi:hypothetical protein
MQLAVASAMPTSAPAAEIRNVHLTTTTATADPRVTGMTTIFVSFGAVDGPYGGHRSTTTMVDGRAAGISLRAFSSSVAERAASQAVADAIRASGLLTAQLPPLDWRNPEPGRTRLYLDRRSRFLEFDTANPPAVVQGILGALTTYEQVARRGLAAA